MTVGATGRDGCASRDGGSTVADENWEAECRGLGWMILKIAAQYEAARTTEKPSWRSRKRWRLGGDDELLWSAVMAAKGYVEGPLAEKLGPREVHDG